MDCKDQTIALNTALNILDTWGASSEQVQSILNLSGQALDGHQFHGASNEPPEDQAIRISYVLNIHEALRAVFENPDNVYGFMSYPNNGPFFNGATPLSVIAAGDVGSLHETYRRVDGLLQPW